MSERLDDLIWLYDILARLEHHNGAKRVLSRCSGKMDWPQRGVYFFMENGENRSDTGQGPRIVRVGTHALTSTSKTTLWKRLSQHKGPAKSGGGNHRSSIFRLLVGSTLLKQAGAASLTWGDKKSAPKDVLKNEEATEQAVSRIIGAMPFVWLSVDDPPGRKSERGRIERNSIALLSNFGKPSLDPPSAEWRGRLCDRGEAKVKDSGLWNQKHVDEDYDPAFLTTLERLLG